MIAIAAGVVAGIAFTAVGSRLVTHLLYGSASADWLYYVAGAALIALVGLFASLLPARCAATVDPLVALRYE